MTAASAHSAQVQKEALCESDDSLCVLSVSVALFGEIKRKSQSAKSTKILSGVPGVWTARHSSCLYLHWQLKKHLSYDLIMRVRSLQMEKIGKILPWKDKNWIWRCETHPIPLFSQAPLILQSTWAFSICPWSWLSRNTHPGLCSCFSKEFGAH